MDMETVAGSLWLLLRGACGGSHHRRMGVELPTAAEP